MSDTAYHHGDLKRALLDAGARALEKVGYEGLSLRGLAAEAGVSPGAPYRHFPSREALLADLAIEGARELEAAYRAAVQAPTSVMARLRGVCEAYLDLAWRRPQLFRLMFGSELSTDWSHAIQGSYALYEGAVATAFPDLDPTGVRGQAAFCWATIHGLALLRLHGRLQRFRSHGEDEAALERSILGPGCCPPRPGDD